MEKYDIVDVHLSSTKSMLDSILEHPILDGDKTYTIAVTEFTAPISAETPLPLNQTFKDQEPTMYLLNVKRKNGDADTVISHISHSMSTLPAPLGQAAGILNQFQRFMPNVYKSIQTVNDLVFYIQEYFTEIQKVYATAGGPGIDGGGAWRRCECNSGKCRGRPMGSCEFDTEWPNSSGDVRDVCLQLFHTAIRL